MATSSPRAAVDPATPTIVINVIKAEGVRQHKGRDPTPSMLIRVSIGGMAQPEVLKTSSVPAGVDQTWHQEFRLPVKDPNIAQLECTLWDESDPQTNSYENFLGEVLLNLSRLVPYKGHYIEQLFYIKQGKTIVTEEQASGTLKLGLRLDIPDNFTPPVHPPTAAVPVEQQSKQIQPQETGANDAEEQQSVAHAKAARQAATEQAVKQQAGLVPVDAESRASPEHAAQQYAEAQRQAAEQAAWQKQAAEEGRQQELALLAQRQAAEQAAAEAQRQAAEQAARMQAQQEESARHAAQQVLTVSPTQPLAQPPPHTGSANSSSSSPGPGVRSASVQSRAVIAVIEAQGLPRLDVLNPQAKIVLQGPSSLSAAQTRTLNDAQDPFWNEKFVFGLEEQSLDDTYICAEIFSIINEKDSINLGSIQPLPVKSLLNGQKMSLPSVNSGNSIFCIDSWFDLAGGHSSLASAAPGKSQLHLRMTLIPAPGFSPSVVPVCRTVDTKHSVSTPPAMVREIPSPPSRPLSSSSPSTPPSDQIPVPAPGPAPCTDAPVATGVFRGRYTPPIVSVQSLPSAPSPQGTSSPAEKNVQLARANESAQMSPQQASSTAFEVVSKAFEGPTVPQIVPQTQPRIQRESTPTTSNGGPADVGIVLKPHSPDDTTIRVHEIVANSPAEEGEKIGVGDVLIDIDGYDIAGRSIEDAQMLLRGQPNTPVTMIFQRGGKGGNPIVVTLLRAILDRADCAPAAPLIPPLNIHKITTEDRPNTRASMPLPVSSFPAESTSGMPSSMRSSLPGTGLSAPTAVSPSPREPLHATSHPRVQTVMEKALASEFQHLSFLWKGKEQDPSTAALIGWKDDLLYGEGVDGTPYAKDIPIGSSLASIRSDLGRPESRYPAMSASFSSALSSSVTGLSSLGDSYSRPISGVETKEVSKSDWLKQVA